MGYRRSWRSAAFGCRHWGNWGQGFEQLAAGALGFPFDKFNDVFDAFRDGRGFQIEVMRAGHRHMSDGAVDFEKLEAAGGKLLAEDSGDLKGEALLIFPGRANEPRQARRAQIAGSRAGEAKRFNAA